MRSRSFKFTPLQKSWVTYSGASITRACPFALFPADIGQPPREWTERFFNVQRWTEMPRGGHFAALEEPELLVDDIQTFFRPFRRECQPD
jgi:pimeloyl-ACP methyl ester carboxylesterase